MAKRKREHKAEALSNKAKAPQVVNTVKKQRLDRPATKQASQLNGTKHIDTKVNGPKLNGSATKHQSASISDGTSQPVIVSSAVSRSGNPTIQIISGSYERALHGITAELEINDEGLEVKYSDSFLMNAHSFAIRCLALSPMPQDASEGVLLATGGSDERVNVYSLSASPLPEQDSKGRKVPSMPSLGPNKVAENPANRELGTLVQHSANVTALHFPSRSKLLSASEDNTISITRIRDLQEVSNIKAPKPKVSGQASGDSAAAGTTPAGVNDFAIHPSMKLMVSVGQGERTMRLWNLVTGRKAGVLNFERDLLQAVKEGKYSHGEGRKIRWNKAGTEFAISFERGVLVFGQDSKARCTILPQPLTKVHHIDYFSVDAEHELLAVSTENGRMFFYSTQSITDNGKELPMLPPQSYTGGSDMGIKSRIKDFTILDLTSHGFEGVCLIIGCSDGNVSLITIPREQFSKQTFSEKPIGRISIPYRTANRITCLEAFVMLPAYDIDGGLSEAESVLGSEVTTEDEEDSS
ncbi:Protein mak11 [Elasticomyces elasticus]|nr:Protein mak11 [Elasticomyces elasticus]